MSTLGNRIKELRLSQKPKMTQSDLAKVIGISREAVSQWESDNTKSIKPENLLILIEFFNIDLRWLITGKMNNQDNYPSYEKNVMEVNEPIPFFGDKKTEAINILNMLTEEQIDKALSYLKFLNIN